MEYRGVLISVDGYMNVQMANAEEYIDGTNTGALGEILIRCNNILYIGGAEDSEIHEPANNASNLVAILRELLQENILRRKGLLTRSIIQAQAFSPTFSHVYADATDAENMLSIFKLDPDFEKKAAAFNEIREHLVRPMKVKRNQRNRTRINSTSTNGKHYPWKGFADSIDNSSTSLFSNIFTSQPQQMEIIDNTEQNLVGFRREAYLTIQSRLDYQEHPERIHILVDCCARERTYGRFYRLLCERFCRLKRESEATFETIARETYQTIHRFDITKLRNLARLISHLLFTDAITWDVLSEIHLNENETTSSGRIYTDGGSSRVFGKRRKEEEV
ncbi:unnamed protein product, partial [Mesorhabditis belari]|uniref:Sm protein F n=1 Tax=Mesorhabditis belari TaxID=2138241 RepID=A0AAF3EQM0_9BILA